MFFEILNDLFEYVFANERVLVYGDLGRLPHVVVDYLTTHHSRLKILFVSSHAPVSIPNHVEQFRDISSNAFRRNIKCDLLVLLEPRDHAIVHADYPGASSVVVFTSHAILDTKNQASLRIAIYFHQSGGGNRSDRIRRLLAKREGSEENDDVQIAKNHVAHPSVFAIGPGGDRSSSSSSSSHCDVILGKGNPSPLPDGVHFIVVDLTTQQQPFSIFLCYLDAFDYMLENLDRVERWSVCFALGGHRKYENFVQECIDRLHCSERFRPYLKRLLPLLPFYVSGTVDPEFDVPVSRMMRHEYVSPDSLDEAFKSAIKYDTKQLVGGVLSIVS